MLQKSPGEEQYGCLFTLLGGAVGFFLGNRSLAQYAAEIRAKDPDAFVCGMPAIPALFGGMFLGGIAGWIVGVILYRLLRPSRPG